MYIPTNPSSNYVFCEKYKSYSLLTIIFLCYKRGKVRKASICVKGNTLRYEKKFSCHFDNVSFIVTFIFKRLPNKCFMNRRNGGHSYGRTEERTNGWTDRLARCDSSGM